MDEATAVTGRGSQQEQCLIQNEAVPYIFKAWLDTILITLIAAVKKLSQQSKLPAFAP